MTSSRKITDYKALTFDCFGTLVDWESGIYNMFQPLRKQLPTSHPNHEDRVYFLKSFIKNEGIVEHANPTALYPDVLADTYRAVARELGLDPKDEDAVAFGGAVGDWPVFPDTQEALKRLQRHFKLVILSNVDKASFGRALTNQLPEIQFDAIYTAQEIGTYKPDPNNFRYLVDHCGSELGVQADGIIHTAYAIPHDLVPAHKAGLATCWIERGVEFPAVCGGADNKEAYAHESGWAWQFKTMKDMADYVDSL
uniref:Haloacid dehalogenase n=1 Tax=Bionectria ochroleuca TaxID=29856 RepID=A0A8H7KFP9_BIOOC